MTKRKSSTATVSDTYEFPQSSREEFKKRRIAKLPASSRDTVERLKLVKAHYVTSGRDAALREKFDLFLENMFSMDGPQCDEGRIFFITGRSGAGKSRAIRHMIENTPALEPEETPYGLVKPFISVSLRGLCTMGVLGERILRAAGYPILQTLAPSQLWGSMSERLGHRHVLLVHIDETQHLIRSTPKASERRLLAEALKGVMNDKDWPVSFIVSGLPEVNTLATEDVQFERRGFFERIPRVQTSDEVERRLALGDRASRALIALLQSGDVRFKFGSALIDMDTPFDNRLSSR